MSAPHFVKSPQYKTGFVSIILPTYNEAGNIIALAEELDSHVKFPKEIIVVDDDSPDGTSRLVQECIAGGAIPGLRLETRTADRGLRKSIERGIEIAQGDIICWMDCDFSHPPEDMALLVQEVLNGADIVIASRYMKGGVYKKGLGWFDADESAFAVLLSRIINWIIHVVLDPRIHDYTSGFVAFRRSVLESLLPLRGDYGEYFVELIYCAVKTRNISIIELPFTSPPRRSGQSNTGTTFRALFWRGLPYARLIPKLRAMKNN